MSSPMIRWPVVVMRIDEIQSVFMEVVRRGAYQALRTKTDVGARGEMAAAWGTQTWLYMGSFCVDRRHRAPPE
jgi:hypothetical protein